MQRDRASSDRQPHSSTDEVIDHSLCCGAIEQLIFEAPNHQPQRSVYLYPISQTDITANFFIDNRYSAVDADPGKDGCFSVVPSWPSSEFSLVARESCEFLQLKLHRMKPRGSRYPTKRWENAWLARIEPEAVCSDLRGSVHQGPLERQEPTRFKGWGISMRRGRQTGAPGLRRSLGLCSGQRLQRQVGALVGNALDLPCRVAEQLMRQVGQGPRGRDLLPICVTSWSSGLRRARPWPIMPAPSLASHASARVCPSSS